MSSKLFLFAAFVISMLLMSMNHKKKRKKIVFFGDSITKYGAGYGGYISILQTLLREAELDEMYELKGEGVAGDKIYDLYLRIDEDVLAKGADIVVVFIGINDVLHKFSSLTGTDIVTFESFYVAIIEKLLAAGIKVMLCTPAVIGENPAFSSREDVEIDSYSDVVRRLAIKYELAVVDIRKAFINFIALYNTENKEQGVLTTDKVHLNHNGNQLVAEEILRVLRQVKLYKLF